MSGKQDIRLRELWQGRKGMWALAWVLGAITLAATVALLAVSGWFISAAAAAGLAAMATAYTFDYFRPAAIIRTLAIARTAGRYGERLASHNAVLALLRDLRVRFFSRLAAASAGTGVLSAQAMHRLTGDIDLLDQWPLRFLMPWLWALLLQTAFVVWLLLAAPGLLVYVLPPLLAAGVLLPALAARQGIALARADTQAAERRRHLLLMPLSILTSLLLWQRWADCGRQFLEADAEYGRLQLRQQQLASVYVWLQQCLLALLTGLLLWQAWPLLQSGALSVPLLLALVLAVFGLNEVLTPQASQWMALGFSMAARDRLNALGSAAPAAETAAAVWPQDSLTFSAEAVSAKKAGALNGVENVNFTLKSGEVLLISGRSGAGKSTLLDVLAGELLPERGRLKLNGQDWGAFVKHDAVGYLAQQVDIFDLTLAENLRLGDAAASDAALWQVLEKVQLAGWARAQPQGLHTRLGEYGAEVSGGQARRIALARLLLKPRALLLLDEPFAGLDAANRSRLADMLVAEQKHGLLILASHQVQADWAFERLHLQEAV
ncbi:ATP-binding cassette domain-containing protein [Uruburuella testudinis]|uniref:ATP-binding cassette domain-containing protein n=1 Tax=Uruburuella testudinis TaxID=1282863 RepID=A0ABY4DPK5_9NEIS|nr:ATP-binding cassette domain-containing protein [Uruburuella testudinis]UOO80987.1 ATP-binding cassette domain-containing protein [Uruburuella testudinis]